MVPSDLKLSPEAEYFVENSKPIGSKNPNFEEIREEFRMASQDVSDQAKKMFIDTVEERMIGSVRVLNVTPKNYQEKGRVIVYIHGGAWTLGKPDHLFQNFSEIAMRTCCKVVAVDYRLAPEHRFPTGLHDCLGVYHHLVEEEGYNPENIILLGESAGGNLCLATTLKLQQDHKPMPGLICAVSPVTDATLQGETWETLSEVDPVTSKVKSVKPHIEKYTTEDNLTNPLVSPLYGRFTIKFPKTGIFGGLKEVLVADMAGLHELMVDAGVDSNLFLFTNLWHGTLQNGYPKETERVVSSIAGFINKHFTEITETERSRL